MLSSRILVWSAPVACTVERASGGVEYVYRGIKREDGNSQSGVRLSCGIDHPRLTALSFKTTSIILVILRKTIIFAHSDAGSTASGVSFYRSYKIIFVGGNQMRQRSFFDFRLNFRYAKIRFILLICNILHV